VDIIRARNAVVIGMVNLQTFSWKAHENGRDMPETATSVTDFPPQAVNRLLLINTPAIHVFLPRGLINVSCSTRTSTHTHASCMHLWIVQWIHFMTMKDTIGPIKKSSCSMHERSLTDSRRKSLQEQCRSKTRQRRLYGKLFP
jgi:thiosulfate reductase cytochrome b subunit